MFMLIMLLISFVTPLVPAYAKTIVSLSEMRISSNSLTPMNGKQALLMGKIIQLHAFITETYSDGTSSEVPLPDFGLVVSSQDPSVASLTNSTDIVARDEGSRVAGMEMHANTLGSTIVDVVYNNSGTLYSAQMEVVVTDAAYNLVLTQSLGLGGQSRVVAFYDTVEVAGTDVSWASSVPSIVVVGTDGSLTGLALGTSRISANWISDSKVCNADLDVTVNNVVNLSVVANPSDFEVESTRANLSYDGAHGVVGDKFTVIATDYTHPFFVFTNWTDGSGNIVSTASPYTFTLTGDVDLTANYTDISIGLPCVISVFSNTGGSVSGGGTYPKDTPVVLTAIPDNGYFLSHWTTVDYNGVTSVVGTNATLNIVCSESRSYTACFSLLTSPFIITTTSLPDTAAFSYLDYYSTDGTTACVKTVETSPGTYDFIGWRDTDLNKIVSTNQTYIFDVLGHYNLVAEYTPKVAPVLYTVLVVSYPTGLNGSVPGIGSVSMGGSVANGAAAYPAGAPVSLTATPATGYEFGGWYENSVLIETNPILTFTLGEDHRFLKADFKLIAPSAHLDAAAAKLAFISGAAVYISDILVDNTLVKPVKDFLLNCTDHDVTNKAELINSIDRYIGPGQSLVFDASNRGVSDLTNLDTLLGATPSSNLTINLSHNNLANLTGLEFLTNVTTLDLSYNKLTDITGLTNLLSVSDRLNLSYNRLLNLNGIPNLSAVYYANVACNYIAGVASQIHFTFKFLVSTPQYLYKFDQTVVPTYVNVEHRDRVTDQLLSSSSVEALPANRTITYNAITIDNYVLSGESTQDVFVPQQYSPMGLYYYAGSSWNKVWGGSPFNHNSHYTFDWNTSDPTVFKDGVNIGSYPMTYMPDGGATVVYYYDRTTPYTITSTSDISQGTTNGDGQYISGTNATVTATPKPGYVFSNWVGTSGMETGMIVSMDASYTFTVTSNRTVRANFAVAPTFSINISTNPANAGFYTGAGSYSSGAFANLQAYCFDGYNFTNWTEVGVEVSTSPLYTFQVTGNRTLVANYTTAPTFNITTSANPVLAGSTSGGGTFSGTVWRDLSASPSPGYIFLNWTENGSVVSTSTVYSNMFSSDRTFVANFIANGLPPIPPVIPTLQSITVSPAIATVEVGHSQSYKATAHYIDNSSTDITSLSVWSTDNMLRAAILGSAVTGITIGPANISAEYNGMVGSAVLNVTAPPIIPPVPQNWTLSTNPFPIIAGSTSGGGTFENNTQVSITAIKNSGYDFQGWFKNNTLVSSNALYSFNITEDTVLEARFTKIPIIPPITRPEPPSPPVTPPTPPIPPIIPPVIPPIVIPNPPVVIPDPPIVIPDPPIIIPDPPVNPDPPNIGPDKPKVDPVIPDLPIIPAVPIKDDPKIVIPSPIVVPVVLGQVSGFIKDNYGRPIVGIIVELHSQPRQCLTDADGAYSFSDVELGNHTLLVLDPYTSKEITRYDVVSYKSDSSTAIEKTSETKPGAEVNQTLVLTETDNKKRVDFVGISKPVNPIIPIIIKSVIAVITSSGLFWFLFTKFFYNVTIRVVKKNGRRGRVLGRRRLKKQTGSITINVLKESSKTTGDEFQIEFKKSLALKLQLSEAVVKVTIDGKEVATIDDFETSVFKFYR